MLTALTASILITQTQTLPVTDTEPNYPLGGKTLAQLTSPAKPLRMVDLHYRFLRAGDSESSVETRFKLRDWGFVGGEIAADRRGAFFDTARTELGVTEDSGDWTVEGAIRGPRVLGRLRAERRTENDASENNWSLDFDGALRLSSGLEILLAYRTDLDDRTNGAPSLDDFIESGSIPALGLRTRTLRTAELGLLYQRQSHFELETRSRTSRLRSEAGFDFSQQELDARSVWNRDPLEVESLFSVERSTGRLGRVEASASVDAQLRMGRHLVAHAGTEHHWERGISRFSRGARAGATFFGRAHRFARTGAIAERVEALSQRAYALGYNERRVYTLSELRALRERLALSSERAEFHELIDAVYRAQVDQRNTPQLGFELAFERNDFLNVEARSYRVWFGIPWRVGLPLSRSEDRVEFLRLDLGQTEQSFPGGITAISRRVEVQVFLNREMALRAGWERPGRLPIEIARRNSRARHVYLELNYAFGR